MQFEQQLRQAVALTAWKRLAAVSTRLEWAADVMRATSLRQTVRTPSRRSGPGRSDGRERAAASGTVLPTTPATRRHRHRHPCDRGGTPAPCIGLPAVGRGRFGSSFFGISCLSVPDHEAMRGAPRRRLQRSTASPSERPRPRVRRRSGGSTDPSLLRGRRHGRRRRRRHGHRRRLWRRWRPPPKPCSCWHDYFRDVDVDVPPGAPPPVPPGFAEPGGLPPPRPPGFGLLLAIVVSSLKSGARTAVPVARCQRRELSPAFVRVMLRVDAVPWPRRSPVSPSRCRKQCARARLAPSPRPRGPRSCRSAPT